MITSDDFIYNNYSKFIDKNYKSLFLIDLKPSDFLINPNTIKKNIYKKEKKNNGEFLYTTPINVNAIINKIKVLFDDQQMYTDPTKFGSDGKNLKLYKDIILRVKKDKIFILKTPDDKKIQKDTPYIDTIVQPNKSHTLFEYKNPDNEKILEFEKVEHESKNQEKTVYYQRKISSESQGYIDFSQGVKLYIEQRNSNASIYLEWKDKTTDTFSFIGKIVENLPISNAIENNIKNLSVVGAIDSETKIVNEINNQIKILQNTNNQLKDKDNSITKQIENLKNKLETIRLENKTIDSKQTINISTNEKDILDLKEKDSKVDTSIENISKTIKTIQKNLENIDISLNDSLDTSISIDNNIIVLEETIEDLSANVKETKEKNDILFQNIDSGIKTLDNSFNDLSGAVDIINNTIKKISTLETEEIKNEGKIQSNSNTIKENKQQIEKNKLDISNIQKDITDNIKSDINTNRKNISIDQKNITTLDSSLNDLSGNIDKIHIKNKNYDRLHSVIEISFNEIYNKDKIVDNSFNTIDISFSKLYSRNKAYESNFDRRLDNEIKKINAIKKSVDNFETDHRVNRDNIKILDGSYNDLSGNVDTYYNRFLTLKTNFEKKSLMDSNKFNTIDLSFDKVDVSYNDLSNNVNKYYNKFNLLKDNYNTKETRDLQKFKSINNTFDKIDISFVKIYQVNRKNNKYFEKVDISFVKISERDKLVDNIHDKYNKKITVIDNSFNKFDVSFNDLSNNVNNLIDDVRDRISPNLKTTMEKTKNIKENQVVANSNDWNNSSQFNYVEFKNSNTRFGSGFEMDGINIDDTSKDREILIRNNGVFKSFPITGDLNINNIGILKINDSKIFNKHINNTANIDISKTNLSVSNDFDPIRWRDLGELKFKHKYIKTIYPLLKDTNNNDINNTASIKNSDLELNGNKNTGFSVFCNDIASNANLFLGTNKFNKFGITFQAKSTGERCLLFQHYIDPTRKTITRTGTSLVVHSNGNVSIGVKNPAIGPQPTKNKLKVNGDMYCDMLKTIDISLNKNSGLYFHDYNTIGSLLIHNGNKFIPKNISGPLSIDQNGFSTIRDGSIRNSMFIDNTIHIDKLDFELGNGLLYNKDTKILDANTKQLINSIQLKLSVDTTQMNFTNSKITIRDRYLIKSFIGDNHEEIFQNNLVLSKNTNNTLKINSNNNVSSISLDDTWMISKQGNQSNYTGILNISKNIPVGTGFQTKTIMAFDNEKNIQIGFENFDNINNFSNYYPQGYKLLINGDTFFRGDIDISENYGIRITNKNNQGNILIANGDKFLSQSVSGHATINQLGVVNLSKNVITNDMISDTTKISTNKIGFSVDTKAHIYDPKVGKLSINNENVLITNSDNNYQVGHYNKKQNLFIKNGNLSFIPFDKTTVQNGGNQKITLSINQRDDGIGKASRYLYLRQLIDDIPQINTEFQFDFEKGRLKIKGGLTLDALESEPSTVKNITFLNDGDKTRPKPTVYFEKGFYINNDFTNKNIRKKDNKLLIIRGVDNIFRPVSLMGPITISENGYTGIQDQAIKNTHLDSGIIFNDNINTNAKINRTKVDLLLGSGLAWANDNKTIINTLVTNNIVEANRINIAAIDQEYFIIDSKNLLSIKKDVFLVSEKNNQYIDGNVYFQPSKFTETGLLFGNSKDYYKFSKNKQQGLIIKQKNNTIDKNIININNDGKIGILSDSVDTEVNIQFGEKCKFKKEILIDKGLITNNNKKYSLFMANGDKFVSVSPQSTNDISLNLSGVFNLKNEVVYDKHIHPNAKIKLEKLNFNFSISDFEFVGNSLKIKNGVIFRNDQGQKWSILKSGEDTGSFLIEGTNTYNNSINLFNNQNDKYSSINIGKRNIDHWNIYNKIQNQSLAIKYLNSIDDTIVFNQTGNISIGFNLNTNQSINPSEKLTVGGNIRIMKNSGLIIDSSGIKIDYKDGNTAGNLLIGQGNNFIPVSPSGHISIDNNGVFKIKSGTNAPIIDSMIKNDAQIEISKTTLNVDDTQLLYDKSNSNISIKDIYIFNNGDGEIGGGLTLNKNENTLQLKGTSNNSSTAPGTMIYFQKASNEGTTSKIGYKANDRYVFDFESENPSVHKWKFNSDVIFSNNLDFLSNDSIIKFNDVLNRKILMSNGNGYKPAWINDCLQINDSQLEFTNLTNGEKRLSLKQNSNTFISSLNGTGESTTIRAPSDNLSNIALEIKTNTNSTNTNNVGCVVKFSPLNNDANKRMEMGYLLQNNSNRGNFYLTNYHIGYFNFNKDIHLDNFNIDEAGPSIILNPAYDNTYNSNGIVFKTNDPTFSENSGSIRFVPENIDYTGGLGFFTSSNTKTTRETERLRINSSGNIGIDRNSDIRASLHIGTYNNQNNGLIKRLAINCNKINQQFEFNTREDLNNEYLDLKYSANNDTITIASNLNNTKIGINNDIPNESLSISSKKSVSDVSMSIISSGLNTKSILYFGNLKNKNNALKTAIIANGKNDKGKSSLHFCVNDTDIVNKNGYATVNDSRMVIQQKKIGINNNDPSELLTLGNVNNNFSILGIQSKPGWVPGIKLYRGDGNWKDINNNNFALVVNDLGFEIIKTTDKGNNYTGRTNYFRINNNGKIGINKKNSSAAFDGELDISGTCVSSFYKGDGRYLDLNMHPLLQLDRNYLHNYHEVDSTFIGKFLCYGTFLSTSKNPLASKKDLIALETGTNLPLEMWGNTNNTSYYVFRPWTSINKAFKISNIINPKDFPAGTSDNYYEDWSISMDLSMNKTFIPFVQKDWVALLNITNTDAAEIYLLNGQIYVKGNGWSGGNTIGNAGLRFNDTLTDVIEEKLWTSITLTFRKFRRSGLNYVEVSFYKNGVFIGSFTPDQNLTPNFRLKNDLLLFNEKDVDPTKPGRYTGYGWVKNITLYKKTLADDEVSYLYLYPERGLGTKHIEDQSVKIKNLEKTVKALTTRLEALENKS